MFALVVFKRHKPVQTYHSSYNSNANLQKACGAAICPLKTSYKGPAPPCKTGMPIFLDLCVLFPVLQNVKVPHC